MPSAVEENVEKARDKASKEDKEKASPEPKDAESSGSEQNSTSTSVKKKGGRDPITNRSPWTKEEDSLVVRLVQEYGNKSWVVIAPLVKTRCVQVRFI